MSKLQLSNICLVVVDCYNYGAAVASIKKSMDKCDFGSVKFLTDIPLNVEGVEVIQIDPIRSKEEYSDFIIKKLSKYIDKDYVLIQQHDSWVLDTEAWDDDFLSYDVLGAAWLYIDGRNCGNGGFSLRTKRLMDILSSDDFIQITHPEDEIIGRLYRKYLEENYKIKFPTDEVCDRFSFELRKPASPSLGFHSNFHEPYKPTIVIKRAAAMGDVVMVEPVLRYFHDKGYMVVLDTLPQFHLLFLNHYFKVHRIDQVDKRLLASAKFVNLDMSYESKPTQLHLKSYFEYAGVPEEEYLPYLTTPKLSIGFALTKDTKLFKKYAIIHVDNRPQGGRNIYGVDWVKVVDELKSKGYDVIQLGKDDSALIPNAVKLNCTNENFLCYAAGGADLFVGIDSGISHIAAAFGVPSVIFFGSVDPKVIHPNFDNKIIIHNHDKKVCDKPFCWGSVIGCEGVKCYIDESCPPCCQFKNTDIINAINNLLHL